MKFTHLILAVLCFMPYPASAQSARESGRPNIVLILADDLGYGSLGCYGSKEVRTPHLDRLAANGLRFTDFHGNGAMCTPTRAALMTGRYPQRCEWVPDGELSPVFRAQRKENPAQRWAWGISTDEVTLPKLLARAGYQTALIGKWHLGYDKAFHPMNHGFIEFRGFVGGGVDYHKHIATHGTGELDWWHDRELQNEEGYTTDLLTQHAVDFIDRHHTKPFFLHLSHAAPHTPWQGRDASSRKPAAETYLEMIEVLDESVGQIVGTLRQHGLEKNTLVIFCSDNGPQAPPGFPANGVLQGRKGSMFEGGHRVPFIATWPGVIPSGGTSDEVAMTMDFLRTFAKLAGAEIPAAQVIDGVDLMPVLKDGEKLAARTLHWRHGGAWAVRKDSWKLIGSGRQARTLVNLAADISEKRNLVKTKPDIASEMEALHQRWTAEVGSR
jgi:arylsulfatase A